MTEVFANTTSSDDGSMVMVLVALAVAVLVIAGLWKTFAKAKHSGWLSIIPIINTYVTLKIAKRPGWWLLLYLIPVVNLVVHLVVSMDVAKAFGKSDVFGIVGLFLFSPIGFLILGFGDAKYRK